MSLKPIVLWARPGQPFKPSTSHVVLSTDAGLYSTGDCTPCLAFGPASTAAVCPPPYRPSDPSDSSITTISNPSTPKVLVSVKSGSRFCFSQLSAVFSEQSCELSQLLGMTNE